MTLPPRRDDFSDELIRISADDRHDRATADREIEHWHRLISSEEAKFSGLLRDLAERGSEATFVTRTGRSHTGSVNGLGQDFCSIATTADETVVLATRGIAYVQVEGSARGAGSPSAREATDAEQRLEELLADLAVNRQRIRYVLNGSPEVRIAQLFAVGVDVVTLGVEEPPKYTLFVPIPSFVEISPAG